MLFLNASKHFQTCLSFPRHFQICPSRSKLFQTFQSMSNYSSFVVSNSLFTFPDIYILASISAFGDISQTAPLFKTFQTLTRFVNLVLGISDLSISQTIHKYFQNCSKHFLTFAKHLQRCPEEKTNICKTSPYFAKRVQTFRETYKLFQTLQHMSTHFQSCSGPFQTSIFPEFPKPVQTFLNFYMFLPISEQLRTCPDFSKQFPTFPNCSKRFPDMSKICQKSRNNFNCCQIF